MADIVSIGEALIDFLSIDKGVPIEETTGFTIAPGGAPANVAAAVAKLGGSSGFIGKVGDDAFGRMIKNTLASSGVDTSQLILDPDVNTTLAFISVKENNEPDFLFYRKHCGADLALNGDEIDEGYILESKILHYGALSFTGEPLRTATLRAIEIARGAKKILSYDPNLRPSLWDNLEIAKDEMIGGLQYADIVKITEDELEFLTGTTNLLKGTNTIIKYGPRIVIVTRGARSSFFNNGDVTVEIPAIEVETVDTTGAGDAFVGGILLKVLERLKKDLPIYTMTEEEVREIINFAHCCGAITVQRKGVIPALPTLDEVSSFMKTRF